MWPVFLMHGSVIVIVIVIDGRSRLLGLSVSSVLCECLFYCAVDEVVW